MIYEDSRNALYCDPNAFIQTYNKNEKCKPKKVVFSEPYESLPAFYIDNNFKKGNCDCVQKQKKDFDFNPNRKFNNNPNMCDYGKNSNHDNNCNHNENLKKNNLGFDIKSLLPFIGMFNKGGGADIGSLVGLLNNNSQNSNNSNPISMISSLISNSGGLNKILNLFKGGQKSIPSKKEIKSTDFEIKNYTRVE